MHFVIEGKPNISKFVQVIKLFSHSLFICDQDSNQWNKHRNAVFGYEIKWTIQWSGECAKSSLFCITKERDVLWLLNSNQRKSS